MNLAREMLAPPRPKPDPGSCIMLIADGARPPPQQQQQPAPSPLMMILPGRWPAAASRIRGAARRRASTRPPTPSAIP